MSNLQAPPAIELRAEATIYKDNLDDAVRWLEVHREVIYKKKKKAQKCLSSKTEMTERIIHAQRSVQADEDMTRLTSLLTYLAMGVQNGG